MPANLIAHAAGNEHPADAMLRTPLCGSVAAATTSDTSSWSMRKRSCTVAQQGGVILSCAGWDGQRWALVVYVVRARLGARKARRGRSTPCVTSPCSVMCHRASKITPTQVVDERLCPTRSRSPQQPARRAQQQPAQRATGGA